MQQAGWFIFGVDTEVNLSRKQILIKEILWNNFKKLIFFFLLERGWGEREREKAKERDRQTDKQTSVCCSTYVCIH